MDTEKQRQHTVLLMRRHKADQEWKCQKQAPTCDAYRVTDQQRMAARRALVWIGTSKAWLFFRYGISDLLGFLWHSALADWGGTSILFLQARHQGGEETKELVPWTFVLV